MAEPLPIVLNFESHDALIVSYYSYLKQERVRIKTRAPLALGDAVALRVRVAGTQAPIALSAVVVESASAPISQDRYAAWVQFDTPDGLAHLEEFIMATDPSKATLAPTRLALRVVVVDDSKIHREAATKAFRDRGDEVFVAEDGLEGLAVCLSSSPDLIVSDVQMPKVDGFQLVRMLKSRASLKHVPIILLTTLSSAEDKRRGYRLGVADYITKPFEPATLLARVDNLLRCATPSAEPSPPNSAGSLRGDLAQLNLGPLLAFLELERKSGTLYLEESRSLIVLDQGRAIRAAQEGYPPGESQRELVLQLLSQDSGPFEFVTGSVEPTDLLETETRFLLMEHARRSDEAGARAPSRTG